MIAHSHSHIAGIEAWALSGFLFFSGVNKSNLVLVEINLDHSPSKEVGATSPSTGIWHEPLNFSKSTANFARQLDIAYLGRTFFCHNQGAWSDTMHDYLFTQL